MSTDKEMFEQRKQYWTGENPESSFHRGVTVNDYFDNPDFEQGKFEAGFDVKYDDTDWLHWYKVEECQVFNTLSGCIKYLVGWQLFDDREHIEGFFPRVEVMNPSKSISFQLLTNEYEPVGFIVYDVLNGMSYDDIIHKYGIDKDPHELD